jgi:hypothetical protein
MREKLTKEKEKQKQHAERVQEVLKRRQEAEA